MINNRGMARAGAAMAACGTAALLALTGCSSGSSTSPAAAISCTSSHFCLMGDLSGNVATFNGATWSATSNVDPVTEAGTGLTGVACADAADCVAVGWEGNALTGAG